MPHALRSALLVCLWLPSQAAALTLGYTGVVETVANPDSYLSALVIRDVPLTVDYGVDLTTADSSTPFHVGFAALSFKLGFDVDNPIYRFDGTLNSDTISLLNDTGSPIAPVDIWQSGLFVASELTPASNHGADFGGYGARLEFFDFDHTVFDGGENQPIDPTDPAYYPAWDYVRVSLISLDGSMNQDLHVQVTMAVPEPRTAALLLLGLASLAHGARRREQAR
jgi:PEP-CTERM motif-containing protein